MWLTVAVRCAVVWCGVLRCAGEHVVVPLLCLSGVVPCPAGEASGPNSSGRVLINLDLTNAQPASGEGGGTGRGAGRGQLTDRGAGSCSCQSTPTRTHTCWRCCGQCLRSTLPLVHTQTQQTSQLNPSTNHVSVCMQEEVRQQRSPPGVSSTTVWQQDSRLHPTATDATSSSSRRPSCWALAALLATVAACHQGVVMKGGVGLVHTCLRVGCPTASLLCPIMPTRGCCWHWG